MKSIIIVGASGFGREVAWVINRMNPVRVIAGFCDDDNERAAGVKEIAPFLSSVSDVLRSSKDCSFFCAIGNNKIRCKIMRMFDAEDVDVLTVVDTTAVISRDVVIGTGSFVGCNSVISVGCELGRASIINHNVTLGHDVVSGDYAQFCPGVRVSGGCRVGEGAMLGSNSCTIPEKKMGVWSMLGAGGVLLKDLDDYGCQVRIR